MAVTVTWRGAWSLKGGRAAGPGYEAVIGLVVVVGVVCGWRRGSWSTVTAVMVAVMMMMMA